MNNNLIPVDERAEDLLVKRLKDMERNERTHRRLQGRLNNLHLFRDHTHPSGNAVAISREEYRDHPLVQLILARRDRIEQLRGDADNLRKRIETFEDTAEPKVVVSAHQALTRLESMINTEMEAIEACLAKCMVSQDHYLGRHAQLVNALMTIVARLSKSAQTEDDITDAELAEDD